MGKSRIGEGVKVIGMGAQQSNGDADERLSLHQWDQSERVHFQSERVERDRTDLCNSFLACIDHSLEQSRSTRQADIARMDAKKSSTK